MLKRLIIFFAFFLTLCLSIIIFLNTGPKGDTTIQNWPFSKDSLSKKILDCINGVDIQFYRPYRGKRMNSIVRVQYFDNVYFDYSNEELLCLNDYSEKQFKKMADSLAKGENLIKKQIIQDLDKLRSCGVSSLTHTDTTIKVVTSFKIASQPELSKKRSAAGFIYCTTPLSNETQAIYLSKYLEFEKLNEHTYFFRVSVDNEE